MLYVTHLYYSQNYVSTNLQNGKSLLTGTILAYIWLSSIGIILIYKTIA